MMDWLFWATILMCLTFSVYTALVAWQIFVVLPKAKERQRKARETCDASNLEILAQIRKDLAPYRAKPFSFSQSATRTQPLDKTK